MPIYIFSCEKCKLDWSDLLPRGSDQSFCPTCGKIGVKQVSSFSSPSLSNNAKNDAQELNRGNNSKDIIKIPQYSDRNTGKSLGFGTPSLGTSNED